ncbi:unnamed protein product [Citrullus colocynthis]|uniref:Secreted protein n=1 Tax=Citrullus colocynthis TaxID=252529 RepID=A0ABP0Z043_9ROSI
MSLAKALQSNLFLFIFLEVESALSFEGICPSTLVQRPTNIIISHAVRRAFWHPVLQQSSNQLS